MNQCFYMCTFVSCSTAVSGCGSRNPGSVFGLTSLWFLKPWSVFLRFLLLSIFLTRLHCFNPRHFNKWRAVICQRRLLMCGTWTGTAFNSHSLAFSSLLIWKAMAHLTTATHLFCSRMQVDNCNLTILKTATHFALLFFYPGKLEVNG